MSIRVALVDPHQMVRQGVKSLLAGMRSYKVVAEASDGLGALSLFREHLPQLIVMELSLPGINGCDVVRQMVHAEPDTRIVALLSRPQRQLAARALDVGARACVLKTAPFQELVVAMALALDDKVYVSPQLRLTPGKRAPDKRRKPVTRTAYDVLSEREREVLQLVSEGLSSKEIAGRLHLSTKTVDTHRQHITNKLGIHSIAELTRYALREGLSSLDH